MSFNLAAMFVEATRAQPLSPVLWAGDDRWDYQRLDTESIRFANGLLESGCSRGDVVAIQLPNVPEFLVAYFGTLRAGMVLLPLNPLLTATETAFLLGDACAVVLFAHELAVGAVLGAKEAGIPLVTIPVGIGHDGDDGRLFSDFLSDRDHGGADVAATAPEDTAVLLYTSGTTGKPKGAELTHFQLFMNCTASADVFEAKQDDVILLALPLFHVFGLSSLTNSAIRRGASLALVPRFEASAVLDVIERRRVSIVAGVPTMLHALLETPDRDRDLSSMRMALSGGSPIAPDVVTRFEERFAIPVLEGYGLTETASAVTFNRAAGRKPMSVGRPLWGTEMRVVDSDGNQLAPGADHVGELLVRGHSVMKGYLRRPAETAEVIQDGWFRTGDLGYVDDDGYYFVVDRIKDLIIRGGYNVYPREIEDVLYGHPDIREAAVIGSPDDRLGEEVVAVVALRNGSEISAEDVIGYCRQRLAAYKYPRVVRFVETLPKGPTNKILKSQLR